MYPNPDARLALRPHFLRRTGTPVEHIIKYCTKFLSRNFRYYESILTAAV
jgi:hypothetical protein